MPFPYHADVMDIPFDHAITQHGIPLICICYGHSFWACHYTPCSSLVIHMIWTFLLILPSHIMVFPCHSYDMNLPFDYAITHCSSFAIHMIWKFLLIMPLHSMVFPCHSSDMNIPFDCAITHYVLPLPFVWYGNSFLSCHCTAWSCLAMQMQWTLLLTIPLHNEIFWC